MTAKKKLSAEERKSKQAHKGLLFPDKSDKKKRKERDLAKHQPKLTKLSDSDFKEVVTNLKEAVENGNIQDYKWVETTNPAIRVYAEDVSADFELVIERIKSQTEAIMQKKKSSAGFVVKIAKADDFEPFQALEPSLEQLKSEFDAIKNSSAVLEPIKMPWRKKAMIIASTVCTLIAGAYFAYTYGIIQSGLEAERNRDNED